MSRAGTAFLLKHLPRAPVSTTTSDILETTYRDQILLDGGIYSSFLKAEV